MSVRDVSSSLYPVRLASPIPFFSSFEARAVAFDGGSGAVHQRRPPSSHQTRSSQAPSRPNLVSASHLGSFPSVPDLGVLEIQRLWRGPRGGLAQAQATTGSQVRGPGATIAGDDPERIRLSVCNRAQSAGWRGPRRRAAEVGRCSKTRRTDGVTWAGAGRREGG